MLDGHRWLGLNNPYEYRDDNLRRLGFDGYGQYLKSELWADIRRRVLERAGNICEACHKRDATQVHHRSYDPATLRGESINALTAVCARCHRKAERTEQPKARVEDEAPAYARLQFANDRLYRRLSKRKARKHARAAAGRLVKR